MVEHVVDFNFGKFYLDQCGSSAKTHIDLEKQASMSCCVVVVVLVVVKESTCPKSCMLIMQF